MRMPTPINPRPVFLLAAMLALPAAAGACDSAPVAEYRSMPPLLAAEPDTAYRVVLHEDGCVSAAFPRQDLRHGAATLKLSAARHRDVLAQIGASGVAAIDTATLKGRLQAAAAKATADQVLYRVSDENIVEFDLPAAGKAGGRTRLVWASLQGDLLNHPQDRDLGRIAALQQVFVELADQAGGQPGAVQ